MISTVWVALYIVAPDASIEGRSYVAEGKPKNTRKIGTEELRERHKSIYIRLKRKQSH